MRAVVDIGSNSVKFTAAKTQRSAIDVVATESFVTRLGRDLEKTGELGTQSVKDTYAAFDKIKKKLDALNCFDIHVVATSAVRDCRNPEVIAEAVQKFFGVKLKILSGLEEARYSMQGAAAAAQKLLGHDDCIFIDLGGASTELSLKHPTFIGHSFQAGAVRCHERLGLAQIPVSDEVWHRAQSEINEFFPASEWQSLATALQTERPVMAVGGTLLLAAKIAGYQVIDDCGLKISRQALEDLNERLRTMTLQARSRLPGMEAGRADIVCAGILVLTTLLRRLKKDEVWLTIWGLRHGLLLDAVKI